MTGKDKISHYQLFNLAKDLEEKGIEVVHLEVGDPYVPPSQDVNQELCKKLYEGYTHYDSPYGIEDFREAISQYLDRELSVDISPDNILATPGSKSGLKMFLDVIKNEVSKALVIEPTWSAYKGLLNYTGIDVIHIKTHFENRWEPTEKDMENIEKEDFQLMILLNPSNPTGLTMDINTVETLVEISRRKNAYIVSDEVYFQTIYEGPKNYPSILKFGYEKAVSLHSLSKSHAMTGYRLGWIVAEKNLIDKMARLVQYSYTNIPVFIQYAGVKALSNPEIPKRLRRIYRDRTFYMANRLEEMGFRFHRPNSTFYIFTEVPHKIKDVSEFILELLMKKHVAVAPGESFGGYSRYIRFSASYPLETIKEGMDRIDSFINEWTS